MDRAQHGPPAPFFVATLVIAVWAISGPLFRFGDTWQLVINTGTTIVTFLTVREHSPAGGPARGPARR